MPWAIAAVPASRSAGTTTFPRRGVREGSCCGGSCATAATLNATRRSDTLRRDSRGSLPAADSVGVGMVGVGEGEGGAMGEATLSAVSPLSPSMAVSMDARAGAVALEDADATRDFFPKREPKRERLTGAGAPWAFPMKPAFVVLLESDVARASFAFALGLGPVPVLVALVVLPGEEGVRTFVSRRELGAPALDTGVSGVMTGSAAVSLDSAAFDTEVDRRRPLRWEGVGEESVGVGVGVVVGVRVFFLERCLVLYSQSQDTSSSLMLQRA